MKKRESEKHKSWNLFSRRVSRPCHRGWLSLGYCRKVESMWLVSGIMGL